MSDKKKQSLIIVLCILAVIIAVVAIAFAPFGKKATGNGDSPNITESFESTEAVVESSSTEETHAPTITETTVNTTSESETETTTEAETAATETSVLIPPSTDPKINPNKNYTFFIDKSVFEASENDDGVTTLTAKKNGSVKITVTPVREMSYKECCRATEKKHQKLSVSEALEIENLNTAYRSRTGDGKGDVITTVYCIDDGKGGCIVIECRTPVGETKYMETIEIMLSMFKVL